MEWGIAKVLRCGLPHDSWGSPEEWFKPDNALLAELVVRYSNIAIGRAYGVSETSVRHGLTDARIERTGPPSERGRISTVETRQLRSRCEKRKTFTGQRKSDRMTVERVGRVISKIGKAANILVRQADPRTRAEEKYASAHDIRRGFAQRMINLGISAETLKLLMRHANFSTTQNFYGGTRSAQSAGQEVRERLKSPIPAFVGGLVGGQDQAPSLNTEELSKLKLLLNRL